MARIKKRGTSGAAKSYITRTQAVRKLQISLPDFRRLCIFKGIYPREPRNKKKASKTATAASTFYYTKDIQYLLHEPLLQKFRDHKALAKKIGRALGRGETGDAARLERTQKPRLTLDHIIKERYPTFVDALRDLDDALSMLFLFANLPSTSSIPPKTIARCQRLCLEFQHYLIATNSLRKSFLSIKGIYYQATIQGQDILWVVPYKFVQQASGDIDFRIMGTFVEFYTTLLGFVNFRLYTSIGLIYPPKYDAISDDKGAELDAFTLQGRVIDSTSNHKPLQNGEDSANLSNIPKQPTAATERAQAAADAANIQSNTESNEEPKDEDDNADTPATEVENDGAIDTFPISTSSDADTLLQPAPGSTEAASLFAPFTFFLSRETPRQPLEFLVKAFGCKRVGWDAVLGDGAFTTNESDPAITHQVVDRPPVMPLPAESDHEPNGTSDTAEDQHTPRAATRGRVPGRTYVQPQWVWDCVNEGKLLRPDLYAPGATLPPHLSPWVKPTRDAYDPTAPLEADDGVDALNGDAHDMTQMAADEDVEPSSAEEDEDEENNDLVDVATGGGKSDDWAGFSSGAEEDASEDEDDDVLEEDTAARQAQRELEAEAAGKRPSSKPLKSALKQPSQAQRAAREKQEQLERQMMMMPRRKRKLFEKMQYSNAKKEEEKSKLTAKRRRIETRGTA